MAGKSSASRAIAVWLLTGLLAAAGVSPDASRASSWEIDTLVALGNVGVGCEIVRDASGYLHVAYIRADTDELVLLSRLAGVWQSPARVAGAVYKSAGCAVASTGTGVTRFSWAKAGDLAQMYAGPEPVRAWALGEVTSGSDNVGTWLSLHQRADSVLSIACRNQTTGALVFAVRDEFGVWPPPTTVDPGPGRGAHSDHVYRDGVGYAFSEQNSTILALLFADPEIAAHEWALGTIRSEGSAGRNVSITMMPSGRPACVYFHYDDTGLGAIHAAYAVGSADYWTVRSVVDSIANGVVTDVTPDIAFTPDWRAFVAYRNRIVEELHAAVNDSVITGIGEDPSPFVVPLRSELHDGFPNPFNPQTTIPYAVATTGHVTLRVYDVRGALVRTLVDDIVVAGYHRVPWNGRDRRGERVASGVYFIRLTVGSDVRAGKVVLVK